LKYVVTLIGPRPVEWRGGTVGEGGGWRVEGGGKQKGEERPGVAATPRRGVGVYGDAETGFACRCAIDAQSVGGRCEREGMGGGGGVF
jgi:hypothetical protein